MEDNIETQQERILQRNDPRADVPILDRDGASITKTSPIELLKKWDVNIKFCDRGCMVQVGCKFFAFNTNSEMLMHLEEYIQDPYKKTEEFNN